MDIAAVGISTGQHRIQQLRIPPLQIEGKRMKVIKGCFAMIVLLVLAFICIGYLIDKNAPTGSTNNTPLSTSAPDATPTPDYTVESKDTPDLTNVQITFNKLPATEAEAAKIVRAEMDKAVAKDSSKEILAMAFDTGDNALADEKYGGPLVYDPKIGSVKSMRQREGLKTFNQTRDNYFSKIEEESTAEGITPVRKWVDVSVVFPTAPSTDQFQSAAKAEISRLRVRQVDITVYGYSGDKDNSASWGQVSSPGGHYMEADYTVADGQTNFQ